MAPEMGAQYGQKLGGWAPYFLPETLLRIRVSTVSEVSSISIKSGFGFQIDGERCLDFTLWRTEFCTFLQLALINWLQIRRNPWMISVITGSHFTQGSISKLAL
jgi:hypothetical protein